MSPRPRTVDDCTILDAAFLVLGRVGPERLTLADVGAEAGLSAATLVQRFGSKREMLLCLSRHGTEADDLRFKRAMSSNVSPLESLFAAAMDRVGVTDSPVVQSNRLAFTLSQLEDPEFHRTALDASDRAVGGYKRMLQEAIEAGELSGDGLDPASLAQTIHAMTFGSMVAWSILQQGCLRARVRNDLEALLNPFRPARQASLEHQENKRTPETKRRASSPVAA